MFLKRLFLFFAIAVAFFSSATPASHPALSSKSVSDSDESQVTKAVLDFLDEVKLSGLEEVKIKEEMEIQLIGPDGANDLKTARCDIGYVSIWVRTKDLKIIAVFNEALLDRLIQEEEIQNDKRTKTFERMVTVAKGIVIKATGGFPENVRLVRKEDVSLGDVWSIKWQRFSKEGNYMYPYDSIGAQISEKHGLVRYSYSVESDEIDTEIKLTKEKAIAEARKNLDLAIKQYNKKEAEFEHRKIKDFEIKSTGILPFPDLNSDGSKPVIANIGWIEPSYSEKGNYSEDRVKALLCWPVRISFEGQGWFIIYIDAKTGEYRGYEYQLPAGS